LLFFFINYRDAQGKGRKGERKFGNKQQAASNQQASHEAERGNQVQGGKEIRQQATSSKQASHEGEGGNKVEGRKEIRQQAAGNKQASHEEEGGNKVEGRKEIRQQAASNKQASHEAKGGNKVEGRKGEGVKIVINGSRLMINGRVDKFLLITCFLICLISDAVMREINSCRECLSVENEMNIFFCIS
jgi:hypothetical protein